MRILLVYVVTENVNMPVLPLGLSCVAASVQEAGHAARVKNLSPGDTGSLEREIREFRPDLFGISMRNLDDQVMDSPRFLAGPVKDAVTAIRRLSTAPVVLGGAGYTLSPGPALAFTGADYGIAGPGERSFPALVRALCLGEKPGPIPGLHVAGEDPGQAPDRIRNLDGLPLPRPGIHLPPLVPTQGEPLWIPVQSRRGCPMGCSYCSTAVIEGRILRKRSPEKVAEMLGWFVEAGQRHFFFTDNTFNLPRSYAHALCDAILAAGLDVKWRAILYPLGPDPFLAEKMARAGCVGVSLGFESGSPKMLASYRRRFTPEDIRRASTALAAQGIGRQGFLLLGGPGETRETVLTSFDFVESLNLESLKITQGIRIYPGTALEQTARGERVILPGDDLFLPRFYMAAGLSDWLAETVRDRARGRPHWQV